MKCKERRYFHVFPLIAAFVVAGSLGWQPARAEGDSKELQAVAQALGKSKLSLLAGIRQASQGSAKAISAKFELEDGKLQLSVYTLKDGKYFEVVVDHNSGTVVKAEPITEDEDYTAAQSQRAAMAKAKVSLRAAVEKALRDNVGYHAVSVTPSLKDGRAVADVTLAKGEEGKTVSVPL